MNLKEYLADGPKKMFSLLEGIITVELIGAHIPHFQPYISGSMTNYEIDGAVPVSKYRVLLTLEEAAQFGFVECRMCKRVKYRDTDGLVYITNVGYRDKADFEAHFKGVTFMSFVDKLLNDCPPPSEEWVETLPEFMKV
jgi:hypothetical protein